MLRSVLLLLPSPASLSTSKYRILRLRYVSAHGFLQATANMLCVLDSPVYPYSLEKIYPAVVAEDVLQGRSSGISVGVALQYPVFAICKLHVRYSKHCILTYYQIPQSRVPRPPRRRSRMPKHSARRNIPSSISVRSTVDPEFGCSQTKLVG